MSDAAKRLEFEDADEAAVWAGFAEASLSALIRQRLSDPLANVATAAQYADAMLVAFRARSGYED